MTINNERAPAASLSTGASPSGKVMNRSPYAGIVNTALTIAALTAVVRAGSVVKELMVAWRFGTSDDLDAFLISVLVPTAVISILASSFNAAFIPAYVRIRQREGSAAAQEVFRVITGWALVLLCLMAALIIAGAPLYLPLIASGFSVAKFHLTFRILCLNTPVVLLSGIAGIWSAGLNAERRFVMPAIAPLATPILTGVLLWLAPSWRTLALIAGLGCGASAEILLLGIALKRRGFSLRPRRPQINDHVKAIAAQYLPVMSGSILMSGTFVIDQAMAAMLPAGSVAALSYGNRIIQLPIVLVVTGLSTALVPFLSRLAAQEDWDEIRAIVRRFLKLTLSLTVPLALLLFLFSESVVELVFKRGAFTDSDVHLVGRVQAFYALQIPSYIGGIIVVRLISAVQANRILLWASSLNLLINIVLNYLFMRWMGVAGIALSTSVVYLFSATFCYLAVMKRIPQAAQR